MSFTWESLRAELNIIGKFLIPVISTSSATGDAAYLVDTTLWQDASEANLRPDDLNGNWIFQPDDATAGDREKRVGGNSGNGLDLTNGRIYPVVSWGTAPQSGDQYEIMVHKPTDAFNMLVAVLERFRVPVYEPFVQGNDEDMDDSDASAFSVSGAGSVTKVTAAGNVDTGRQSLFFNAGTAAEYCETGNYRVTPNQSYDVSSAYRVDDGGPVAFAVWDKKNDAEIDNGSRVSHSLEGFYVAQRRFSAPSTCEEISLRWYVTNATDNVYIDRFQGPVTRVMRGPSWLTNKADLNQILIADYERSVAGDAQTVYAANSRVFDPEGTMLEGRHYNLRTSLGYANPIEIELTDEGIGFLRGRELWFEGTRPATDTYTLANNAAGETSPTVNLDKRLVAIAWGVSLCEDLLLRDPTDTEANAFLNRYTRLINGERVPAYTYADLMEDYERSLRGAVEVVLKTPDTNWSRL